MKTIFIIEDDGLMNAVLTRFIKKEGFHSKSFTSPREAFPEIIENNPDLVISDINMPWMSGIEMAEKLREQGINVPILFVSGFISEDVRIRARSLGVTHLLKKPLKNFNVLLDAIENELSKEDRVSCAKDLDEIRRGVLTELSHELRTPLTAIKLALEGLNSQEISGSSNNRDRLISISRRNVDRIITHVESELTLLQMSLGDLFVSRQLIDLAKFMSGIVREMEADAECGCPDLIIGRKNGTYVFTDPDILRAVVEYSLRRKSPSRIDRVDVEYLESEGCCALTFYAGSMVPAGDFPGERGGAGGVIHSGLAMDGIAPIGNSGFEARICKNIIETVGGRIHLFERGEHKSVQILLPVFPVLDRVKDVVNPLRLLRRICSNSGRDVALLKCRISQNDGSKVGEVISQCEFIHQYTVMLSEGDMFLRGERKGDFLFVLMDRTREEINHALEFLHDFGNGRAGNSIVEAKVLDGFPLDEGMVDDVLQTIE